MIPYLLHSPNTSCRFWQDIIKGLSIESDSGVMEMELWRFFLGLGITFWAPPYPKIEGGRIYSGFSLPRSPPPIFASLYMLGLEPETCRDRTVRSLPGRYSPVSFDKTLSGIYLLDFNESNYFDTYSHYISHIYLMLLRIPRYSLLYQQFDEIEFCYSNLNMQF